MARIPASVTNIIFGFAERGDGGACGPTRSRPPVIDLANNRWRFNFILPIRLDQYRSHFPASALVTTSSWLPRPPCDGRLDRLCRLIVAWTPMDPRGDERS